MKTTPKMKTPPPPAPKLKPKAGERIEPVPGGRGLMRIVTTAN